MLESRHSKGLGVCGSRMRALVCHFETQCSLSKSWWLEQFFLREFVLFQSLLNVSWTDKVLTSSSSGTFLRGRVLLLFILYLISDIESCGSKYAENVEPSCRCNWERPWADAFCYSLKFTLRSRKLLWPGFYGGGLSLVADFKQPSDFILDRN